MRAGTFGDAKGQGVMLFVGTTEIRIYTSDMDTAHELADLIEEDVEDIYIQGISK